MQSLNPLQEAVVLLLQRVPNEWQKFEPESLSENEKQAIISLVGTGLIERRCHIQLRMFNSDKAFRASLTMTGENGLHAALEGLLGGMWHQWQQCYEEWTRSETRNSPPFHCRSIPPNEWRLTGPGHKARDICAAENDPDLLDFILRGGEYANRPVIAGEGRLENFSTSDPNESPAEVNVGNWADGGEAFGQAIANALAMVMSRKQPDSVADKTSEEPRISGDSSGLPKGRGAGQAFEALLGQFLGKRTETYYKIGQGVLDGVDGAAERFCRDFGSHAIASQLIKDVGGDTDDKRELKRVAVLIENRKLYQDAIKPLRQNPPQRPKNWDPPEPCGVPLDPLLVALGEGDRRS